MTYRWPFRLVLMALIVCALIVLIGMPSIAQEQPGASASCVDHATAVKRLKDRYGETRRGMGLHRDMAVIEIYSSEKTGTFSILRTTPDDRTCVLVSGGMWSQEPTGEGL
jgi:hypothetical protein